MSYALRVFIFICMVLFLLRATLYARRNDGRGIFMNSVMVLWACALLW